MPYIDQAIRTGLDNRVIIPIRVGELNYVITKLCHDFIRGSGRPDYAAYNEVIGVLECAKLEMYRRIVAPYEDIKKVENGDIYYA